MSAIPLQLFYYPGHASLAPHILLQELGLQYQLVLIDIKNGAQFDEAYCKINPQCKVPALSVGSQVITESAAICSWLALNHKYISTKDNVQLQWMFFLSSTLQPALMEFHYPEKKIGDEQHVCANAKNTITAHLQYIDSKLSSNSTLSKEFSVSDIYLLMLCYWCRSFFNEIPGLENLKTAQKKHRNRPSVDRALNIEGIQDYMP